MGRSVCGALLSPSVHLFSATPSPDCFSMKREPQTSREHSDRRAPPLLRSPRQLQPLLQPPGSSVPPTHLRGVWPSGTSRRQSSTQGLFLHAPGGSGLWAPDHHCDLIWPFGLFSHPDGLASSGVHCSFCCSSAPVPRLSYVRLLLVLLESRLLNEAFSSLRLCKWSLSPKPFSTASF